MIATIRGEITIIESDSIVVETNNIGIKVFVPAQTRLQRKPGDRLFLFTQLVVREDSLSLFGFESKEQRDFFNLFLSVSGIGPKTALSILSTLSVETIRKAILGNQPEIFGQVPGIGKKSAPKIMLFLQGKIKPEGILEGEGVSVSAETQVLQALINLGYSIVEAQAALQHIPGNTPDDIEARITAALQYFAK